MRSSNSDLSTLGSPPARSPTGLCITSIPAFNDNYFWLISRGNKALVIDPGDASPVESTLRDQGLELIAIVLTHRHADHIGGVPALLANGRDPIPVYGPASQAIACVTHPLAGGAQLYIDELSIELDVIDVPGHTAEHIAYFGDFEEGPALFCGDTLFATGCGRLFDGTPEQMVESLSRLMKLPPETRIYCAHEYTLANIKFARVVEPGNQDLQVWEQSAHALRDADLSTIPTTLGHEMRTNPFLRWNEPEIRLSASTRAPGAQLDGVSTFAIIREWKNGFKG